MAAIGNASTAQQPRSFGCHGWLVLKGAYIVFLIISIHSTVATNSLQLGSDQKVQNRGICQSVDIRNTLDSFSKLEGCRVVEGFVQILLFDNVNEVELANISFPELTEITDYLLLYRVYGLRSVGQLFPNLSVIRGQNPFFSHSLVIFEMSSLQEIALPSLTDILKGLIRIDKNPSLCFVNSIDWDLIAHEKGEHFIKSMKPQNECPICPGEEQKRDDSGSAVRHCPRASPKLTTDRFPQDKYLCWNRQHCQRVCPSNCRSCTANGTCCSSSCLGGCSITNTSQCTVCRNLTLMENDDTKCVDKCPQNFFEFLGRRCVSLHECEKMKRPFDPHYRSGEYPYKIYNNESCVLQCPQNYTPDEKQHRCLPCEGRCKKECSGVNIDSTALAKQLNGCTHITSSLEIQIRGGLNIVNELEVNLGMIEEIFGYLKIVRSFPLVSLNFLKSLKRIRGKHLESDKYSLIVLDNQNLQDLWDWQNDTRNLTIERGKLFFHFNPKLCINKIKKLQQKTGVSPFDELEVAPNSNGDKVPCDVVELNVTLTKITAEAVIMTWKSFSLQDHRQLLGYIVYSVKSPYKNMTWYDSRDACGGDDWRVDDVPISENESTTTNAKTTHMVAHLKPFTQYAFYVKTYTISTEKKGAQSNISYFTTLPDKPSPPRTLIVSSNSSDTLKIIWEPPQFPNGNVTYYMVTGKKEKDQYLGRDYCSDARPDSSSGQVQPSQSSGPAPTTSTNSSDTCPCENKTPNPGGIDEEVELLRINFENELQNEVYHKRTDLETRKKRNTPRMSSAPNDFVEGLQHNTTSSQSEIKNVTINGIWQTFNFTVYSPTMELVVNGLQHATSYEISVRACRDIFSNTEKDHCSNNSLQSRKTLKKDGADRIVGLQVTNQSLDMVHVTWTEPSDPNGQVIAYIIRYKRVDMDKSRHNDDCIQKNDFNISNQVYTLKKLLPGNYSLTVRAITSGNYADRGAEFCVPIYFVIPEPSNYAAYIVVASLFVILTFLLLAWYFYHKRKMSSRASMRLIPSVNPEYVPSMYEPDEWEVPRRNITLCRELGQGSFGMVYEGLAKDIKGWAEIKCAVKTVNEHATARERLEFLNEASVMKAFDTSHVVRLLGVVSEGQPTLVIMELMAHGDLKTYLRSHRPDSESNQDSKSLKQPPSLRQIMQMAIEISDGMAYLSAKKFVHRDLAARNCMVCENLTVKIGDFGMTRDIYETDYYRKGTKGLLPVRWMAPESLKDGVFTSHSDVWSYGVVLWEMATLASQPYQGLSNDQVLRYVIDGGVMERPEKCPDKLYSLMRYCWQHKPSSRPTFLKLCSLLLEDSNENFVQVSFYHSAAGIEARNSRPTPSPSQDDASTPLRMVEDLDNRFSLTTDSDDEFQNVERQLTFPSISVEGKDGLSTANGYVSGCPTNGAATTQC